ncbi:MAG TPA: hypothetical protein VML96_05350, partial [Egibacteraceae bacterium]|nr:hypothetical protein [Egibacteraceae bacterium]
MGDGAGGSRRPRAQLPEGVPDSVRAFVRCTSDSLRLDPSDSTWLPAPDLPGVDSAPEITVEPGSGDGEFDVTVGWGFVSLPLTVSVSGDGQLVVDTSNVPGFLGGDEIQRWVEDVNADLRANGNQLAPLRLERGTVHFTKQPLAAVAEPEPVGAVAAPAGGEPVPPAESALDYLEGDVGDAAIAGTFGAEAARRRQRQRLLAIAAAIGCAAIIGALALTAVRSAGDDEAVAEPPQPQETATTPAETAPEASPSRWAPPTPRTLTRKACHPSANSRTRRS